MGKKKLDRSWYYLTDRERHTMRWVTVIIGAIRLRKADVWHREGRQAVVDEVVRMAAGYRATWTGLTRGRHLSGMTWRGSLELAVQRQIEPGGHCEATLDAMGLDASPIAPDERIVVVHAHLVLAADDEDVFDDLSGERWAAHIRGVLRQAWPGSWRILVKDLYSHQTVREAVHELYGYCNKGRLEYSDGGWGDVPTRYVAPYEPAWHRLVAHTYLALNVELRSRR